MKCALNYNLGKQKNLRSLRMCTEVVFINQPSSYKFAQDIDNKLRLNIFMGVIFFS